MQTLAEDLHVEFCGPLAPDAMPAFFHSIDLFALTSLWPENLPIVLLEALASATPCITSDIAGVRELAPDERSRFAAGDARSLARCLQAWLEDRPPLPPRVARPVAEMVADTLAVYAVVHSA